LLEGQIEILDQLPPMLAQGLYATPATYTVAMRVSTIPGDVLDDNVSVPRGMALKLIGVPGERLDGSKTRRRRTSPWSTGRSSGRRRARRS